MAILKLIHVSASNIPARFYTNQYFSSLQCEILMRASLLFSYRSCFPGKRDENKLDKKLSELCEMEHLSKGKY